MDLKPCPYCDSENLDDCYVYIQCKNCLLTGPQMQGGSYDDHADFVDHENAVKAWNLLPRRKNI